MSISGLSASDMTDTIVYSLRFAMASVARTSIDNVALSDWAAYSTALVQRRRLAAGLSLTFSLVVIAADAQAARTALNDALTLYPDEFVTYLQSKATELKGGLADGVTPALVVSSISVSSISPTSKPTTLIQGQTDKFLDKYFGGHSSILVVALSGAALLLVIVAACCLYRRCCCGKPAAKAKAKEYEESVEAAHGVGDAEVAVSLPAIVESNKAGTGSGDSSFNTPQRAPLKRLAPAASEQGTETVTETGGGAYEPKEAQAALPTQPLSPAALVSGTTDAVVWALSVPLSLIGVGAFAAEPEAGQQGGRAAAQQHHKNQSSAAYER